MQSYWGENTGAFPTHLDAREDDWFKNNKYYPAFFPKDTTGYMDGSHPSYLPDASFIEEETVQPEVQLCFGGKQTAQEAADAMAKEFTASYKKWMLGER